jgi:hypothetical protein
MAVARRNKCLRGFKYVKLKVKSIVKEYISNMTNCPELGHFSTTIITPITIVSSAISQNYDNSLLLVIKLTFYFQTF